MPALCKVFFIKNGIEKFKQVAAVLCKNTAKNVSCRKMKSINLWLIFVDKSYPFSKDTCNKLLSIFLSHLSTNKKLEAVKSVIPENLSVYFKQMLL
jgi:hypothetical protein